MKNTMKRMLALALALMMCLSVAVPTFAADTTCPGKDLEHMKANCSYTFVEEHEPTCEKQGYTTYKCNTCGKYFADDIVAVTGKCEWVVVTEATCKAEGLKKCSVCGAEEKIAKTTTHDYVTTTEPTCEADGVATCSVCGATKVLAKGAHKYEYDRDITACGLPGEKANGVCAICEATTVVDLGAHDYGKVPSKVVKEPSCVPEELAEGQKPEDFQGLAEFTCKKCGDVKEVVIYVLDGHTLEDVALTTPTCENGGTEMKDGYEAKVGADGKFYGQTCKVCGWQNWTEVAAEHTYKDTPDRVIKVTCEAYGYDFYGCTRCGHTKTTVYEPLNHSKYTDYPSVEDICTKGGTITRVCDYCDHEELIKVEAAGHKYEEKATAATCKNPGTKWDECTVCGHVANLDENATPADASLHVAVKDEVNSAAATCFQTGVEITICEVCNEPLSRVELPALEHVYDDDGDGVDDIDHEVLPLCGEHGTYVYRCSREGCPGQKTAIGQMFNSAEAVHHGWNRQDALATVGKTVDIAIKDATGYTCKDGGVLVYICNYCTAKTEATNPVDITFVVTVPANSHIDANGNVIDDVKYPTQCGESFTVEADFACAMCDFAIKAGKYTVQPAEHNLVKKETGKAPFCAVTYECDCVITVVDAAGNAVATASGTKCTYTVDAVEHSYKVVGERDAACELYGYRYVSCEYCYDAMYVDNYAFATGHDMKPVVKAPTCTVDGSTYDECANGCGKITNKTAIPALGHLDKDGNVINVNGCYVLAADGTKVPVTEDIVCYRVCCCSEDCELTEDDMCSEGNVIDWMSLHNWVHTYVEGTCVHADYYLHVCTVCEYNYVDDGFVFGEHDYTGAFLANGKPDLSNPGWKVMKPSTYTECGVLYFNCLKYDGVQCKGYTTADAEPLKDIKFTLAHDSGIKAGADIVNSGKLVVNVLASAYDVNLHSIDLNINYDSTKLVYTGFVASEYLSVLLGESGVVEVGTAVKNNIGIYMANGKLDDVNMSKIDGQVLITLYFDVKADTNDATSGATSTTLTILDDVSVLKAKGTDKVETNLIDTIEDVTIQTLGNVTMNTIESSKNTVDDYDGRALIEVMMTANGYKATADINKDGAIDLVDYAALAKYIAAGSTYADLCANGIEG